MGRSPRMLAGFVQASLEAIANVDRQLSAAVRQRLKPETLDAIESASPRALLSVDLDVEVSECLFALAGAERARRVLRENLHLSVGRPLVLGTGFRLLGRSPGRIARWAPTVWGLVYRDAGVMRLEHSSPGAARLRLTDLPLVIAGSPHYLDSAAQTCAGLLELSRVAGTVAVVGPELRTRTAAIDLGWTP